MYGLPDNFDTTVFHGRTLELVSFAEYSIYFYFDLQILITLESSYELHSATEGVVDRGNPPVATSKLMTIVGKQIESARASTDGTLTLTFPNGTELRIFDDSAQYESYSITIGENTTYV